MNKKLLVLLPLVLSFTSCNVDKYDIYTRCENHFSITSDFKNKYPDEGDYLKFISNKSYIDTYYYPNSEGYDCHYYLEYNNGDVIDKWCNYTSDNYSLYIQLDENIELEYNFTLYNSPSIDYIIIGTLEYEGKEYHILYSAKYYYTANG